MLIRERNIHIPKNRESGATSVEFAIVAALLFILLFGILELGFIFMQEHYVANAAREGVRIGIRANNFNCFESPSEEGCKDLDAADRVFRAQRVIDEIKNGYTVNGVFKEPYLKGLYGTANPEVTVEVERDTDDPDAEEKKLTVTVTAPNVFPPILSGLIKLIPGSGFELPRTITFKADGEYEDPSEP